MTKHGSMRFQLLTKNYFYDKDNLSLKNFLTKNNITDKWGEVIK